METCFILFPYVSSLAHWALNRGICRFGKHLVLHQIHLSRFLQHLFPPHAGNLEAFPPSPTIQPSLTRWLLANVGVAQSVRWRHGRWRGRVLLSDARSWRQHFLDVFRFLHGGFSPIRNHHVIGEVGSFTHSNSPRSYQDRTPKHAKRD